MDCEVQCPAGTAVAKSVGLGEDRPPEVLRSAVLRQLSLQQSRSLLVWVNFGLQSSEHSGTSVPESDLVESPDEASSSGEEAPPLDREVQPAGFRRRSATSVGTFPRKELSFKRVPLCSCI